MDFYSLQGYFSPHNDLMRSGRCVAFLCERQDVLHAGYLYEGPPDFPVADFHGITDGGLHAGQRALQYRRQPFCGADQ